MYVDNLTDRRQGVDGIYNVGPLATSFYVPDDEDYPERVATLVRAGILKISSGPGEGLEKNGLPNGFPEAKPEEVKVEAKEEPVEVAEEVVEDGGDNTESTATESKPKSTARRGAKK